MDNYCYGQDAVMKKPSQFKIVWNKIITYLSKPQNVILVILAIALTAFTIGPVITIVKDTFVIHDSNSEIYGSGLEEGAFSLYNWKFAFAGKYAKDAFYTPLWNTILMASLSCLFAVAFGGIVAYLVTRTNLKFKKYISSIFIFPYIMPQWTLATVWKNTFDSLEVVGKRDGILASLFGITMPGWWCQGLFPCALVLGLHYAPFAYILIGGIFRNMDANLEEAATILNTPKHKIFFNVTLPMVKPAILSTVLLVFSSAMGSYPVPHYLAGKNFSTLAVKYVESNVNRQGLSAVIAVVMMVIGVAILIINQVSTSGRKSYTTVTGKSGQASYVNIGKAGKYIVAIILILFTAFTSIYPIISFAIETFCPNPGDYSAFTTKWWTLRIQAGDSGDSGTYGQNGILFNSYIWKAFGGSVLVAGASAIVAGTIGTLVGYCVSKNRKGKLEGYVNNIAFLPYLLPSLAVGAAFFVFGSDMGIWDTYLLIIIVGTIKYIPFASRASLSSMMQISGEIEESAIIQNVPWFKRMFRIIIPIQKSSILSGYLLPFISAMKELTLFMMLCTSAKLATLTLDYFDEMGLYAFSSAVNLILVVFILLVNAIINKLTGASLDSGIGG